MHCNLHDQHRRTEHSAWWTRGLDRLHETFRPITFRLLPVEIADRGGCWQGGYGFFRGVHLELLSRLQPCQSSLAQQPLEVWHKHELALHERARSAVKLPN
jgi:hypothetical protein